MIVACWNFHLLGICFLGSGKDQEGELLDADWIEQWRMRIDMKNFLIQLLSISGFGARIIVRS